ncbi:Thiol-disulfide oxidoreductase ResA [Poriferisphaera corsica]|uniref:Thiol-disulfide oxidoreductase ResA n=1 Tax=Poriferisphaera corsica TaxID=2528020 RepID=A0A517YP57_9BACT|nr:TlpA disulfide reductase family protein [Poriferisphaera corsica]QDU32000.1 Thiol-disulfide oxidoreductase ResA [Poriferisphaera corsica]
MIYNCKSLLRLKWLPVNACLIFILFICIGFISGQSHKGKIVANNDKWNIGDQVDYQLRCIGGEPISRRSMRGKYVVLHFWASWHVGSRESLLYLKELWPDIEKRNAMLVSVSLDKNAKIVRAARQKFMLKWPQFFSDQSHAEVLAKRLQIDDVPQVCILSKESKLLWIGHPIVLKSALERLYANVEFGETKGEYTTGEQGLIADMREVGKFKTYRMDDQEVERVKREIVIAKRAAKMENLDLLMEKVNRLDMMSIYDERLRDRMIDLAETIHRYILNDPVLIQKTKDEDFFIAKLKAIHSLITNPPKGKMDMRRLKNVRKQSGNKLSPVLLERKLNEARALEKTDIIKAYHLYIWLKEHARLTESGKVAINKIEAIRKGDQYGKVIAKQLEKEEVNRFFNNARKFVKKSNRRAAIVELETLLRLFPESNQAKDARLMIRQLRNEQIELDRIYGDEDPEIVKRKPLGS